MLKVLECQCDLTTKASITAGMMKERRFARRWLVVSMYWKVLEVDKTSCWKKSQIQRLNYVNNIREKNQCELMT